MTTPESQFIPDTAVKIDRGEISDSIQDVRKAFFNHFRFKLWGVNNSKITTSNLKSQRALTEVTKNCIDVYAIEYNHYPWNVWIDHTPRHIKHVNLLSQLFPNSRFIHIIRDGRGVFASIKPLEWGPTGVIQGAKWWAMQLAPGLAAEKAFGDYIMRVKYEELISNPQEELKRICDFTDLEFDQVMLSENAFSVPEYTKNQHKLVGTPPDKSVICKWKSKLSPREIELFESISGHLLEYLGYDLLYGLKARAPSRRERFGELVLSWAIKKLPNKLRGWFREQKSLMAS